MRKGRSRPAMVTGFAWFDKKQWQRLTEVADDKQALDPSFEEWERNATKLFQDLQRHGQRIEKVHIKVDELAAWCKSKGLPLNSEARSQYVASVLRKRDAEA